MHYQKNYRFQLLLLWLTVLLINSCQGVYSHPQRLNQAATVSECRQFLGKLNHVTAEAGLRDAQYTNLPDFPHLRVNRFLASLLPNITDISAITDINDSSKYHFWLDQAAALAQEGFDVELDNLGPGAFEKQIHPQSKNINHARLLTRNCFQTLLVNEKNSPHPNTRIRTQAIVKDNYSSWQRALGIYPLVILPVAWGINNHQKNIKNAHKNTGTLKQ